MYAEKEIPLLISSDPAQGSINLRNGGSTFDVQLQEPLELPKSAFDATLEVQKATIWFTTPNILTGTNDKLYITAPDTLDVVQNYTITIPQGLYTRSNLNIAVQRELQNAGAKISPSPVISIDEDSSVGKVVITFNYTTVSIDFTQTQTPRLILGFNSAVYGPFVTVPHSETAPNVAAFNTINYFLIKSSLATRGIRVNNNYGNILTQVLITATPGNQITYEPRNPTKFDSYNLLNNKINQFTMNLTNESGVNVDTAGEYWSTLIVVRYKYRL